MQSYDELERRVALIERQLTRARANMIGLGVLAAAAIVVALAPHASAQQGVKLYDAPALFVNDHGQTVVEISDQPGRYGISVYGRKGGKVFIGTSGATDGGLIQLYEPADTLTMQLGPGGAQVYAGGSYLAKNKQAATVAALGVNSQNEGYLSLGNPKGDAAVEAGITSDNRGFVVAHPTFGPPPQVIPRWLMGGRGGGGAK